MSPLTRRRLAIFRAHRRGLWSLRIFAVIFVVTLFAEFVANDRPLVVRFDGHWYFPVLHDYGEDIFGPDFIPIEADYTDPALVQAIRAKGWMIWPAVPFNALRGQEPGPTGAGAAVLAQPAGHRRSGARRAGARDLWHPHLGAVRLRADHRLLDRRHRGRRGAGILRRPDRSAVPAIHRDLVGDAHAVHAHHPGQRHHARASGCC